jgi:hypothetical protein
MYSDDLIGQWCVVQYKGKAYPGIIVRFSSLPDRDLVLNSTKHLTRNCGFSVMTDLPPNLSKLRSDLLTRRYNMPADERRQYKLKQMKDAHFLQLVKLSRPKYRLVKIVHKLCFGLYTLVFEVVGGKMTGF